MERQGQAGPAGELQTVVQRTQVLLLGGERWEPGGAQAAPPAGQLIFFLCRAASLRGRGERLRAVLRGVREQSRAAPTALLAVLVQPAPGEEAEARRRLDELLREAFPPPGPEVHTAVFRPRGALELRPAEAPREQPEDAVWISRATLFKVLGVLCVACAGIIGSQYMNTSI